MTLNTEANKVSLVDLLTRPDFKDLVFFTMNRYGYVFKDNEEDLIQEVRVSIFKNFRTKPINLSASTIIVNHTRWVIYERNKALKKGRTSPLKYTTKIDKEYDESEIRRIEDKDELDELFDTRAVASRINARAKAILYDAHSGFTYEDISQSHKISKQRVHQIVKKSITTLKGAYNEML